MKHRPFAQVDVFTAVPYLGNPLAVVLDGTGLSTEQMQAFTNWTNLSEATFVLPAPSEKPTTRCGFLALGVRFLFLGTPPLAGACAPRQAKSGMGRR